MHVVLAVADHGQHAEARTPPSARWRRGPGPTLPMREAHRARARQPADDERTGLAPPSAVASCCHDDSHLSRAVRGSDRSVAAGTPWRAGGSLIEPSADLHGVCKQGGGGSAPMAVMRTVLREIEAAKRAYSTRPFFQFLRDESYTARERLAFVPCMAPFVLDFGDLNALRAARRVVDGSAAGARQRPHVRGRSPLAVVPRGPRPARPRSRAGRPRTCCGRSTATAPPSTACSPAGSPTPVWDATPAERLVVIEAIEATGNVLFTLTAELARAVERERGHRAALPRRLPPGARVRARDGRRRPPHPRRDRPR